MAQNFQKMPKAEYAGIDFTLNALYFVYFTLKANYRLLIYFSVRARLKSSSIAAKPFTNSFSRCAPEP